MGSIYVRHKKEINFDDMDFNQFVFGESRLINRNKIDQKEKETRIHLMQRISKLNSKFGFEVAKELYRDTLNGIEEKEFKWGNIMEIQRIEMDIKSDNIKFETGLDTEGKSKNSTKKISKDKNPDIVWCKNFNFGRCTFQSHHKGKFNSEQVKKWHICKACWTNKSEKKFHKVNAEDCPLKDE